METARAVLYPAENHRSAREEPRYLCKCTYVSRYKPLTREKLVYLLADFSILFSLDYQMRDAYRENRRRLHNKYIEKKQNRGEEITKEEKRFEQYHRIYTPQEIKEFETEKGRVDHLKALFDKLAQWQAERLTLIPEIDFSAKPNIEGDLSEDQCREIYQATLDYLKTMRSTANISESTLRQIVAQWYHASKKEQTFPFCYMAACTAKSSRLFTSSEEVDEKEVESYLEGKLYRAKRPKAQQRVDRMRFMRELIKITKLSPEESTKNWRLFLQVHGAGVSSEEEEKLWREIIWGDAKESGKGCEVPPIETQILCRQYLEKCLPIDPGHLLSYGTPDSKACSGGYAKFLEMHMAMIEECAKLLASHKKLSGKAEEYLKSYWAESDPNIHGAREFCKKVSEQFRWSPLEKRSQCSLYQFCKNLFTTEEGNQAKIRKCIDEIKALITETGMRIVLTDRARNVLRDSIKQELNSDKDAVNFQIEIPANLKTIESR